MKILDVQDPDYYEWTTHIFFDDCMEPDDSGYEYQVWYLQYLVMPRLWFLIQIHNIFGRIVLCYLRELVKKTL